MVFALGLNLFICNTLTLIFFLTKEEYKKLFLDSFDDLGSLIPRFFINIIFQFIYNLFRILTLVYYTPTHLLICLSLSKFLVALIDKDSSLKYLSIIPFLFQFFCLMVYLEIIELNFCGLNENTKRNISSRINEEMLFGINNRDTVGDEIEFSDGYLLNSAVRNSSGNTNNVIHYDVVNLEMELYKNKVEEDKK